MERMLKRNNWLICIDLDGTFLKEPKEGIAHFEDIHEGNVKVIKELKEKGHEIAIITGRPWRDTKVIYETLGLETVIGNFNGSYIHNPTDKGFVPVQTTLNRYLVKKMIRDMIPRDLYENAIVELLEDTYVINKEDDMFFNFFHIDGDMGLKIIETAEDIKQNPLAVTIKLKLKHDDAINLVQKLKRYYGHAFALRIWNYEEKDISLLEINHKSVSKANAMKQIASYYNIPVSRTISFGDGTNDIEMLAEAAHGVAMKNASNFVKAFGNDTTDLDNTDGGVGDYLNKYFR